MTGSPLSRRVYRRRISWVGLGIVGIRMRVDGHCVRDSRSVTQSSGHSPHISKRRKSPKRANEVGILSEIPSQARNIFDRSTFFAVLNNVRVGYELIEPFLGWTPHTHREASGCATLELITETASSACPCTSPASVANSDRHGFHDCPSLFCTAFPGRGWRLRPSWNRPSDDLHAKRFDHRLQLG